MGLSEKERKILESLQKKEKEPDAPPLGRSAVFNIDLGDDKQVSLARRLGLISDDDDDDADDNDSDDADAADDAPKQQGYFGK